VGFTSIIWSFSLFTDRALWTEENAPSWVSADRIGVAALSNLTTYQAWVHAVQAGRPKREGGRWIGAAPRTMA
jgi:hypothetical protein